MNINEFNECLRILSRNQHPNGMNLKSKVLIHTEAGALFNVHGMRYDRARDAWIIVGAPL